MTEVPKMKLPQTCSKAQAYFPANVIPVYLPNRDEIPEPFRSEWSNEPFCRIAAKLFYEGGSIADWKLRPEVEQGLAEKAKELKTTAKEITVEHFHSVLGSFEPKHEHKIGGVGWMLYSWFIPETLGITDKDIQLHEMLRKKAEEWAKRYPKEK